MSDTEQNNQPKTEWRPIIKDMLILVAVMGVLGGLCKLAMLPFQEKNPSEDLVSIAAKGNLTDGKDKAFEEELKTCLDEVPHFSTSADKAGRTPLMWVVYANYNNPVKGYETETAREYYIKKIMELPGSNVNQKDKDGFTAMHWAAWSGLPLSVALLAEKGGEVNLKDTNGYTPLMLAAMRGNDKAVATLLALGADASEKLPDGRTALDMAKKNAGNYADSNTLFYSLIYKKERDKAYKETVSMLEADSVPVADAASLVAKLRPEMKAIADKAKAEAKENKAEEKSAEAKENKAEAKVEEKAEQQVAEAAEVRTGPAGLPEVAPATSEAPAMK